MIVEGVSDPPEGVTNYAVLRYRKRRGMRQTVHAPSLTVFTVWPKRYLIVPGLNRSDKSVALTASPNQG